MTRYLLIAAPLLMSCTALAQPPAPRLSPTKLDQLVEESSQSTDEDAIEQEVRDTLASLEPESPEAELNVTDLSGTTSQGGLVFGKTRPGSIVRLVTYGDNEAITDSRNLDVDEDGNFIFGFDRDHGAEAVLMVTYPGQSAAEPKTIPVKPRAWRESSIQVEESKANPFLQEDLDKIARDSEIKAAARREPSKLAMWKARFAWPADGCVSSEFGSRRIVNGTPRRFHSGVDVAAPDGVSPMEYIGTEVRAPSDGIVRLADPDMFFEGGLIFIDHGQGLFSYLMHLSSVDVQVGDMVEKGDPVGKIGMTGRVTGPHLHWSLKWQDRLLDPKNVVPELAACTD